MKARRMAIRVIAATAAALLAAPAPLGAAGAETAPAKEFAYNPVGKPDPFKPFIEAEIAARKRAEELRIKNLPLSPLQRSEVETFRLEGIAGSEKKRTALLKDPVSGKYFIVEAGTPIGTRKGRVATILPDRVIVAEPAAGKGARARKIEMKLRRGEGEKP